MKLSVVSVAAAALFAASSASATSSIFCRTTDRPELELDLSVGHPPLAIAGATLRNGSRTLTTGDGQSRIVIAQSWLDDQELKLDLADSNVENFIARLRTRKVRDGVYAGTLRHGERTLEVICSFDEAVE